MFQVVFHHHLTLLNAVFQVVFHYHLTLCEMFQVVFHYHLTLCKMFQVVFHYQCINEPAMIKRLVATLNKSTGEVVKNRPK